MAGVPATITMDDTFSEGSQEAALIMAANFDVDISPGYSVIADSPAATGNGPFHLAHPEPTDQFLTDLRVLAVMDSTAELQFASRLGAATEEQVARVQTSLDGSNWTDLYTQPGAGQPGETSITTRRIPLGDFAGRIITLRYAYTFSDGFFFPQTFSGVGWYIDDTTFTGVDLLTDIVDTDIGPTTSFEFTPGQVGDYAPAVRAQVYDEFFLDWGYVRRVSASDSFPAHFRIGDANDDGVHDITDALSILATPLPRRRSRLPGSCQCKPGPLPEHCRRFAAPVLPVRGNLLSPVGMSGGAFQRSGVRLRSFQKLSVTDRKQTEKKFIDDLRGRA